MKLREDGELSQHNDRKRPPGIIIYIQIENTYIIYIQIKKSIFKDWYKQKEIIQRFKYGSKTMLYNIVWFHKTNQFEQNVHPLPKISESVTKQSVII